MAHEKLWRYSRVSRLWARTLIVVGAMMYVIGAAAEWGDPHGDVPPWLASATATTVMTTVLFMFLLRSWMRDGALPSARLDAAVPDTGATRPPAGPRDWGVWTVLLGVSVLVVAMAMTWFLVGTLGGGGIAEGVVVGVFLAWGIVTMRDVRLVDDAERTAGREYYAACRRPVSIGRHLVWRPAGAPL